MLIGGVAATAGKKPLVVQTIEKALAMFTGTPVRVGSAARQLGMHLVEDSEMEITFTPRDREFSAGAAVREWKKEDLAIIMLDVSPHATVKFGPLRDAFGPFKMVARQHPGDDASFVAHPTVAGATAQLSVTMQKFTERPGDDDLVSRISVTR